MPDGSWALVTGASEGLGADLAATLAGRGFRLILTARREEVLNDLALELSAGGSPEVRVVPMDLSVPGAGQHLADRVQESGVDVDILVNNAGFGLWGPWLASDEEDEVAMLRLNMESLTVLTRRLVPAMVARRRGGVLNVASTAAFLPGPFMTVYYATKAYVLSFSEGLREELRGTGVAVTCLCPGPVRTGFQARAGMVLPSTFRLAETSSASVARAGVDGLLRDRALVIPGLLNRMVTLLPRVLPRTIVPGMVLRAQARRASRDGEAA